MKKTSHKKSSLKKAKNSTKAKPPADTGGQVSDGMVDKQPQVKDQAAVARAMFLRADDAWAEAYYNPDDLHFLEREVFG
jgi:hypothetical protein